MAGLIDIGANLAHESFDADLSSVLQRAKDNNVEKIVVTGSSLDSARHAQKLAASEPGYLYFTAGLHPHHADEWNEEHARTFRSLASDPNCVALGECGLDYFRDLSPREAQLRAFEAQLEIAADLCMPLFLHQRDAHIDFLPLLKKFRPVIPQICVHCFTDTTEAMLDYLALDCYIGITGWVCDKRRGQSLRESVRHLPLDRLLIETDAPYLRPHNAPAHLTEDKRRNEPFLLPYVVEQLADSMSASTDSVSAHSTRNALNFFNFPQLAQ